MALEVGPGGIATLRIEGAKKLNILNGDACDRAVAEINAAAMNETCIDAPLTKCHCCMYQA